MVHQVVINIIIYIKRNKLIIIKILKILIHSNKKWLFNFKSLFLLVVNKFNYIISQVIFYYVIPINIIIYFFEWNNNYSIIIKILFEFLYYSSRTHL